MGFCHASTPALPYQRIVTTDFAINTENELVPQTIEIVHPKSPHDAAHVAGIMGAVADPPGFPHQPFGGPRSGETLRLQPTPSSAACPSRAGALYVLRRSVPKELINVVWSEAVRRSLAP